MSLYDRIIRLLSDAHVPYDEYEHDPILSYEDAERERERLGWKGIESKNVFLKGANGAYYVYVTTQGQRVDMARCRELLGTKLSIASEEDVRNVIHCMPGCVAPFGFDEAITILIDPGIFHHTDYLFSPGVTTKTIRANVQDLKAIFERLPNRVAYMT